MGGKVSDRKHAKHAQLDSFPVFCKTYEKTYILKFQLVGKFQSLPRGPFILNEPQENQLLILIESDTNKWNYYRNKSLILRVKLMVYMSKSKYRFIQVRVRVSKNS